MRNNGCGVTTAGFSGDNTPLVVYPLVVEWADRMVFHIEYGSHRHNILFHSFWLKQRFLQMSVQWGVKFNLRTMRRSNAPAEENALFMKKQQNEFTSCNGQNGSSQTRIEVKLYSWCLNVSGHRNAITR